MNQRHLYVVQALPPEPEAPEICDTTRMRHLGLFAAIHEEWDLIFGRLGLTVPRDVADPEDPTGPELLEYEPEELSEIANAERFLYSDWMYRNDLDALPLAQALQALRQHPDLRVIDPDSDERDTMEVLAARTVVRDDGQRATLGRGERAVLAIADNQQLVSGLDEGAARQIAREWGLEVVTTQDALRRFVDTGALTRDRAEEINERLLAGGFWGAERLY